MGFTTAAPPPDLLSGSIVKSYPPFCLPEGPHLSRVLQSRKKKEPWCLIAVPAPKYFLTPRRAFSKFHATSLRCYWLKNLQDFQAVA